MKAVEEAVVLVGAARLLALFPWSLAERVVLGASIHEALDTLDNRLSKGPAAVLVSGDPGLFSLSALVLKRFGREKCRVIPGVSSVQAAFAALGIAWAEARIISAHRGRPEPDADLGRTGKIAVLTGNDPCFDWLKEALDLERDPHWTFFSCENLTMTNETIRTVRQDELSCLAVSPHTVLIAVRNGSER
jgi:precorrin-6y C5,15-methyltransferase (decarboxylating) CbiE subunit